MVLGVKGTIKKAIAWIWIETLTADASPISASILLAVAFEVFSARASWGGLWKAFFNNRPSEMMKSKRIIYRKLAMSCSKF